MALRETDQQALGARGIPRAEAERQLDLLARPPRFARLDRPCTIGDGIEQWSPREREAHAARAAAAIGSGRCSAFVPASGAATRMFKELLAWRTRPGDLPAAEARAASAAGDVDAGVVERWWSGLARFAFHDALVQAVGHAPHPDEPMRPWLAALLGRPGLGYADLPKALLAFHQGPDGVRTAFDEHLAEGATLFAAGDGTCRLHFTVSPEHREGFHAALAHARATLEAGHAVRFEVTFSEQHPATDTLAADPGGGPFRDAAGDLLFRPAGHGALIANLGECAGDLVFLKNIDNVAAGRRAAATADWARALAGRLVELEEGIRTHTAALERGGAHAAGEARAWLAGAFGTDPGGEPAGIARALTRPIRVCGMVPNTGEPGGGPFWVSGPGGRATPQIVETAEVDPADPGQRAILGRATHFNPVFMVCALRDVHGRPYDLAQFVDPAAVIVARKSSGGRELLALERPGLWNGAMAHWNTRFVEVPLAVFNPVKGVLDLLRPEHQP